MSCKYPKNTVKKTDSLSLGFVEDPFDECVLDVPDNEASVLGIDRLRKVFVDVGVFDLFHRITFSLSSDR